MLFLLAAALTVGLYTRPKVVVRNENKQLSASTPGGHTTQSPAAEKSGGDVQHSEGVTDRQIIHEQPLSAEQQKQMETLRTEFARGSAGQKEIAGVKLIALFHKATRYDSAAHYG